MFFRFKLRTAFCLIAFAALSAAAPAGDLDLNAYKGKVVYLDFWASWCNPCRQSFSWMNGLENDYASKGLVIIAVNVDHDRDRADAFLQHNPAQFKIVYDADGAIAQKYDFKDMPTTVLIGRDGKVRYLHNGFYPSKQGEYLSHLTTLFNEKAS